MKKIQVLVKLKSKKEGVELTEDGIFIVRCNEPPIEGKANKKIITLLSKYLNLPKSKIQLRHGQTSKNKIFEILD
jgi:uncharacterized protein